MIGEPWHGYAACPVCGSAEIVERRDGDMIVVACDGCGQTLHDSYDPDEDHE